jgi:hypothetical protein
MSTQPAKNGPCLEGASDIQMRKCHLLQHPTFWQFDWALRWLILKPCEENMANFVGFVPTNPTFSVRFAGGNHIALLT